MTKNWKAEQLEYEFIRDTSTDEICVTLTKQQATFLYSITNVFNWRTRWYSRIGAAVDMDTLQSMIADANSRLQTGLEGECVTMPVVADVSVNEFCQLVVTYADGSSKTENIPIEDCVTIPPPVLSYVKTIELACEDGMLQYTQVTPGGETFQQIDIASCVEIPDPVLSYVKTIELACEPDGQLQYTQHTPAGDTEVFIDIASCITIPDAPTGQQIGLPYYSTEVRCKVAQFMADHWREHTNEMIEHAIAVGAMDFAQLMFMGAYIPKHGIYAAADLAQAMTNAALTPLSVWLTSTIRADSTLTCIFYDNLPVNLVIPGNFSTLIANAIEAYMPGTGSFTVNQIAVIQGYVRYWSNHQWQNVITEALWHPNYTPTYCDVCAPVDPGTRWSGFINFATNDGDPPYIINGGTYVPSVGLRQTNLATPIIIGYDGIPLDQACIRVSMNDGDRVTMRIVDQLTDTPLAEVTTIWHIGDDNVELSWDGTTDPLFPVAENGVYFYVDFDDLGTPGTLNHVARAGVRGWGTFTPLGFVSGSVCG